MKLSKQNDEKGRSGEGRREGGEWERVGGRREKERGRREGGGTETSIILHFFLLHLLFYLFKS